MKLERYNQILFSVVGTLMLLGGLFIFGVILIEVTPPVFHSSPDNDLDINVGEEAADTTPDAAQSGAGDAGEEAEPPPVRFCMPEFVAGSNVVFVSVNRSLERIEYSKVGRARSSDDGTYCPPHSGAAQNSIAIGPDGSQHFVFDRRVHIHSLAKPTDLCREGRGGVPCDLVFWTIRDLDTDRNGSINSDDAASLFATDLRGKNLRRLTPKGSHLIESTWAGGLLYLRVQEDADGDGKFGGADPVQLLQIGREHLGAAPAAGSDADVSPAVAVLGEGTVRRAYEMFQ